MLSYVEPVERSMCLFTGLSTPNVGKWEGLYVGLLGANGATPSMLIEI